MNTIIKTLFTITVIFTLNVYAQIQKDKTIFTGNIGYQFLSNGENGHSMDGFSFGLAIEFMAAPNFSLGFGVGTVRSEDTCSKDSLSSEKSFSSWPIVLLLKYYFILESNVQPYIGFNIGWHYSDMSTVITGPSAITEYAASRNGLAISIPVGIAIFLSKTVFINTAIAGTYYDNTPFGNSLNFSANVGVDITY